MIQYEYEYFVLNRIELKVASKTKFLNQFDVLFSYRLAPEPAT